ncbi:MAG: hypothetical protein JW746_01145 [Candidatus Krumholzibacteriota bacterium]|nr:hypothetical protein [Candidatus Krumholzibacteriota bacterium]
MRKSIFIVLLLLAGAVSLNAETCITTKEHTDASYHHGTVEPASDSESEVWIGEGRIASIGEDHHLIFDFPGNRLTIIQLRDSSYVEAELPLDMTRIVAPEMAQRMTMFQTTGEVKALDEKKDIGGRECVCYFLGSWIDYMGTRFRETERTSWVTTDLPFDIVMLESYYDAVFRLNNFGSEYIEARKAVVGLEIFSESIQYSEGQANKSTAEVVEIAEKDPPAGVYTVPEGYVKKDVLTPR